MGDFAVPYIIIAFACIIIWTLYRLIIRKRYKITKLRECVINLFFIYFLAVIYYTFFKSGELAISFNMNRYFNITPLVKTIDMFQDNFMGIGNSLYNVIGNILLFVPLGFFIPLLFKKGEELKKVVFYGFIGSITIEILQYFTPRNITDIDDVIFNTLGAALGFIVYKIFKKFRVKSIINKVQNREKDKLIVLAIKPLGAMLLIGIMITCGLAYKSTYSPKLSNEEMAVAAFTRYSSGEFVAFDEFDKYKLSLKDEGDYLELGVLEEAFMGRYARGWNGQMNFEGEDFGYGVELIQNYEDNEVLVVVYGKNSTAEKINIKLYGKDYSQDIEPNEFFIAVYPQFTKKKENTDIYNVYDQKESKDLKVEFLNSNGEINKEIKFLK